MKLNSLILENYRKFKKVDIEFPDGVIGITGLNGVGKSTMIEAISWVLYGNQSSIVRTEKKSIKREGCSSSEVCRVVLEFEIEGNQYKIIREMKGKSYIISAEAYVNKKLEATNAQQVTEFVEKTLSLDHQSFFTSVFARQNELDSLSRLEPFKRKKLILRMLNIDSIEKAMEGIKEDKKFKKQKIDAISMILYDKDGNLKIDKLKNEKKQLMENFEKITLGIKKIKEKLKVLRKEEISLKRKKVIEDEKNKKNYELKNNLNLIIENKKNLENRIIEINHDLNNLMEKEKRLDNIKDKDTEFEKTKLIKENLELRKSKLKEKQRIDFEIQKLKKDLTKRESEISSLKKELNKSINVEKDMLGILKSIKENENKKLLVSSNLQKLSTKIENLNFQKNEIVEKKNKIKTLGTDSECPTCEKILGEQFENLIFKFESEINIKKADIIELEKKINVLKNEFKMLEKRDEALLKRKEYLTKIAKKRDSHSTLMTQQKKEFEERKNNLNEKFKFLNEIGEVIFDKKKYETLIKELQKLSKTHDEITGLKKEILRIDSLKGNLKETNKKLQKLKTDFQKLKNEIIKLDFVEKKYKNILSEYEKNRTLIVNNNLKLTKEKTELKSMEEKILSIRNQKKEMKIFSENIKEESIELQYLEKLIEVFGNFKTHLIYKIGPSLSVYASDLFSKLTEGKYSELELNENYEIFIRENGKLFPINRFSGGEMDLANLCIRLAISKVIAERSGGLELNFIILDEIFGSQDIYRKRNIISALNELSKQFRQIFLITHIEDIKDYMNYVFNVVEGEDGISDVRVYE